MSRRNWLHAFAFGVALFVCGPALGQDSGGPQEVRSAQEIPEEGPVHTEALDAQADKVPAKDDDRPSGSPPPASLNGKWVSEEACDSRCQASEQREKDDLKAQQSMAESTVEMALSAWFQVVIGILALGLLAVTVHYTYRAAVAAENANKAANAAVKVAREQTNEMAAHMRRDHIATHRPHLRFKFVNPFCLEHGKVPTVDLTFANIGGSHAILEALGVDVWLKTDGRWLKEEATHPLKPICSSDGVPILIQPGARRRLRDQTGSHPISAEQYEAVQCGDYTLALVGEIKYRDDLNVSRHTGFYREYDPISKEFVRVEYDRGTGQYIRRTRSDLDYEE